MTEHSHTDVNTIKRRFLALNRERVQRINASLRWRQRDFLKLLPLLLHVNDDSLPGFVSKDAPAGISNFKPARATTEAAKHINKKFRHSRRALSRYNIHSVFLTGSSGTVAHTEESDFDIWVIHRPDMEQADIELLESKCRALGQWCASLELEVYFFLMDENRFRNKEYGCIGKEHSGTAQPHLLLEEFYRSGVYIAGRYPLWWLVPPEHEQDYDDYVGQLRHNKRIREYEVVDFGGLDNIPAEEFFGASLWQIYKGIDSPYKSVLKILLMEAYANEYPAIELLCQGFKRMVYEGASSLLELDPYIMMCHKVEDYLASRGERDRLELVRRCFYFKTNIQLSKTRHSDDETSREGLLKTLVDQWGWDDAQLLMLDSRPTWKIHRVLEERKKLVDELTRSYKLLSGFANQYAGIANINQRDMTVLGRKLYAAFERKAGKIDIVNPGISPNLIEEHLSFIETADAWLLYRGKVSNAERQRHSPLKRSRSVIELLCWCHFNHLIGHYTSLSVQARSQTLAPREIKQILSALDSQFPRGHLPETDLNLLGKASHAVRTILFINVGIDPMAQHRHEDRQIISNRTNALSYSGLLDNLVLSVDQVSTNTWQEVYSETYNGINEVMECLCKNIQMSSVSNNKILPVITAYSFSSSMDQTVARRVETVFADVIRFFHRSDMPDTARYIIGVEDNYYRLQKIHSDRSLKQVSYSRVGSYHALIDDLSHPLSSHAPVMFDRLTLYDHFLPDIFKRHTAGNIDVYIHQQGRTAAVYVLDEKGSLFTTEHEFYNLQVTLAHYDAFFYATAQRINASCVDASTARSIQVNFHTLRQHVRGWEITPCHVDPLAAPANALDVTVIIELVSATTNYRVFCGEREFSSLEFGDALFDQLATHILSLRIGKSNYPMYITDIDLPFTTYESGEFSSPQTINYLQHKVKFEQQLNTALTGAWAQAAGNAS